MFKPFSLAALTRSNLKQRRRTYVSFVVGIILAVTFISVIAFFLTSLPASYRARHINERGYADVVVNNIADEKLAEYEANGWIKDVGLATVLGHYAGKSDNQDTDFNVASLDATAVKLLDLNIAEGRLPEKPGEIALEFGAAGILRQSYKLGDSITLPLYLPAGDGKVLQDKTHDFTFTVVGLIQNRNATLSMFSFFSSRNDDDLFSVYPMAYVSAAEPTLDGAIPVRTAYLTVTNTFIDQIKQLNNDMYRLQAEIMPGADLVGYDMPFLFVQTFEKSQLTLRVILFSAVFLALVIAAAIGIANSLAVVLEERKQQIGLLRAVGATKVQLRRIYRRETFLITLIAIPLAVLLAAGIVLLAGRLMTNFVFSFHPAVVLLIVLFSFAMIFLASFFPLRRASAIPPMQAIRNVDMSRKLVRKARVASLKRFIPERLLTKRNQRLYRGQKISIGIFLALSLALSMALSLLFGQIYSEWQQERPQMMLQDYGDVQHFNLLLNYDYLEPGFTDGTIEEISRLPLVKKVAGRQELDVQIPVDQVSVYFKPEYHELVSGMLAGPLFSDTERSLNEKFGFTTEFIKKPLVVVDDAMLTKIAAYVYEGQFDKAAIDRGEAVLMFLPALAITIDETRGSIGIGNASVNTQAGENVTLLKNEAFKIGDTVTLRLMYADTAPHLDEQQQEILPDDVVTVERHVRAAGFIDEFDRQRDPELQRFYLAPGSVITSQAGLAALGFEAKYRSIDVFLKEKPDQATEDYLVSRLTDMTYRTRNGRLTNMLEFDDAGISDNWSTFAALSAVFLVFLSICIGLVNHNITARVRADKRVIGTMRAVGAPERVLQRSVFYQILRYFVWGAPLGYAIGLVLVYFFYRNLERTFIYTDAYYGVLPLALVVPLVFLALMIVIASLSARRKVRQIFKRSIVDNIRQLTAVAIIILAAGGAVFLNASPVAATAASPRLLITDYAVEEHADNRLTAGSTATLRLELKNMQASQLARNIVVTLKSADDQIIPQTVASVYVDLMLALATEEVRIPFEVLEAAAPGIKEIEIGLDYQDAQAASFSSTQPVYVSVAQDVRLEHDDLSYVRTLTQGNVARFELNLMNMGKGSVNNALIRSQIPGIAEGISAFVGTVDAGKSETATLSLHVKDGVAPGVYAGRVELLYEGMAGEAYSKDLPVELEVLEKCSPAAVAEVKAEEKSDAWSERLPWLIGGGAAFLLLVLLLLLQRRTIRRLRRAEEARL